MELIYELYFSYSQGLFEKIKNKTIRIDTKGKTDDNLILIKKDPIVMVYLMAMIEKLNYISFQIHGINS